MQREEFTALLKPVIDAVAGADWSRELGDDLNRRFPADGEVVRAVTVACHAAIAEGWMC